MKESATSSAPSAAFKAKGTETAPMIMKTMVMAMDLKSTAAFKFVGDGTTTTWGKTVDTVGGIWVMFGAQDGPTTFAVEELSICGKERGGTGQWSWMKDRFA